MKSGFEDFWQKLTRIRESGLSVLQGLGLEHMTREVFGWRRPIIEYKEEPRWVNTEKGTSPFESALMVWHRQCYPHNHLCNRAGYAVLPSYPESTPEVEYYSEFNEDSYKLPAGTVVHKFWKPIDHPTEDSKEVLIRPIRTGEWLFFECISETYVLPGTNVSMGPKPYHTLAPLPGYSATSINVYMPPLERFTGRKLIGGPQCASCSKETYEACSFMREAFEHMSQRDNQAPVTSPAHGSDISPLIYTPKEYTGVYL